MLENNLRGSILLIGVLDVKGSTNIPMGISLMRHGFDVIPLNYRTVIRKYGYPFFCSMVMSLVVHRKPDLVVVCKGNGIHTGLINEINKYSKTWIFNMDPKSTIDMVPEVVDNAVAATFSSCTALDMAEEWKALGANSSYLVQGVDEQMFRPMKPVKKYKADISLIGTRTPLRDQYKEVLEQEGYDVKFYGRGYTDEEVIDDDFSKVCSSSSFMLSVDSVAGVHTHYYSNRLVRYLGCGACTLHFDPTETLNEQFVGGVDLIYFKSPEELVNILKNKFDRYSIALNGYNKVLNEYTWDTIMFHLLSTALPEKMEHL